MFTRPDSPPPRQPSPEFVPTPLPSPHLRLRNSSQKLSPSPSLSPLVPPGLNARQSRHLVSTRSDDHLSEKANSRRDAVHQDSGRRRTRSTLNVSPPTTPRSLPLPSPSPSHTFRRGHRRCLSFAVPYLSPPPSPTTAPLPPPVPPIPAFALTPGDAKSTVHLQPTPITPIRLPELDTMSPLSPTPSFLPRKKGKSSSTSDGRKNTAMTCWKFFSLRNSSSQGSIRTAV